MDGVLVDAKEWHYESLNSALSRFGLSPIARKDHLEVYDGLPTKEKLKIHPDTMGLDEEFHRNINKLKQEFLAKIIEEKCSPSLLHHRTLQELKKEGYKLAVCSNAIRQSVEVLLSKMGLISYIDFFLSNQDVEHPKPHPEIYVKAIKKLGIPPESVLTCITFISEWSLSTLGFYEFSNNFKFQNTSYQHLPNLENLNLPVRQFFRHLTSQSDPDRFAEELLSSINAQSSSSDELTNPLILLDHIPNSLFKNGTKAIFYIVPTSSLIVNCVLSYNSIYDYTSSLFITIPYMALTTLPSFALQMYTTASTVDDLWGDTVNKRSYLKAKSRKLFYIFGGLSILLSVGSSLWGIDIVDDAFKESFLKPTIPFFMFTTAAQLIIFESHCIRDYFAKKYFRWKEVKGTESEKNTTTLFKILVEISENSKNTSSNNYAWYNPIGWFKKCSSYLGICQ